MSILGSLSKRLETFIAKTALKLTCSMQGVSITSPDVANKTRIASQVIAASFSALFYWLMFFLGILGIFYKPCTKLSSSKGTLFVFFVGALVIVVNVFQSATNTENDLKVRQCYRLSTVPLIGILFTLIGVKVFFRLPDEVQGTLRRSSDQVTLGRQQPSMGLIVSFLTVPLMVIEFVLLCATFSSKKTDKGTRSLTEIQWLLTSIDKLTFLIQKVTQAGAYLYLRNTIIRQGRKENVTFYFRLLSFFNFIQWVDTQVNVENDIHLSGIKNNLGDYSDVFIIFYEALVIDYRLMCALLFLEHWVEVQNQSSKNNSTNQQQDYPNNSRFRNQEDQNGSIEASLGSANDSAYQEDNLNSSEVQDRSDRSGNSEYAQIQAIEPRNQIRRLIGYALGCLCLIAPVLCGLQFLETFNIGPWVTVFAIIVNVFIVICGASLLHYNYLDDNGQGESDGVKIMVCLLGAVGFTCWMVEAAIFSFWASPESKVQDQNNAPTPSCFLWEVLKYFARSLTTAFLIFLFTNTNAHTFSYQTSCRNHFLVPAVMLGVFSMFGEGLVDQKAGPLNRLLRSTIENDSLRALIEAGPPLYLGFLIHVFLYFIIIEAGPDNRNRVAREETRERSPLLTSSSDPVVDDNPDGA